VVDVEVWYRQYGESIFRRCLRLTRDETRALDLTQEVFLRAHRYQASYRAEASPLAWLCTIADRCFFDALRREKRSEPVDPEEVEAFVQDETEGADKVFSRHDLVARLLERAPKDVRRMVTLRYFDELGLEEIAERLGVNERTVRRKLERFLVNARKYARRTKS
jgi:RNA polymerase sigma-70 factor (ECF subfamily)